MDERKIVVPGEIVSEGDEFLPGENVRKENNKIISSRYGLLDISGRLVKIIPLAGSYIPKINNIIIGQVVGINYKGWLIDFDGHFNGFLSVSEVPKYISKGELRSYLDFGDSVCAKIIGVDENSVELTINSKGLGKINEGMLVKINPNKVPRVIGKEGSMVNLIKEKTKVKMTVGQNGIIWLKGEKIEDELKAKKIIEFICENSYISGLTEKVEEYIKSIGEENE